MRRCRTRRSRCRSVSSIPNTNARCCRASSTCRRNIDRLGLLKSAGRHSFAPPSVLPDISPTRGEIGSVADRAILATLMIGESRRDIRSPPVRAGLSGESYSYMKAI
ncbi:hypothetical protein MESS4_520106 [Mesorhizobium sp. STM 4661]|nr:hypothetical protein MESS4_520106 [Mesorhizobium sp. STM 4661]